MRARFAVLAIFLLHSFATAAEKQDQVIQPDPKGVRWKGPAYRYAQHGWTILHIEGKPYERGHQHGFLMADEIAGYLRCFAAQLGNKAPSEAWQHTRTLVNAIFLRKFEKEYLEEMQGIADGASEAGARFDGRKLDLIDVAALNLWAEIETLDSALEATPTGLEGIRFPKEQPKTPVPTPMDHCSAFAATGPATADGKVVFGHITMFSLYPANFYNVWLDVKPADGFRIVMQSYPGGIQSGMDYYMNEKGILLTETTIRQTKFNVDGMALASRVRKALQYAESIDQAVEILRDKNNGLYTNEWLLADTKTNEIAMLELGTHRTKLMRSSKGEWFGGTEGFYWGCNNVKDIEVRLDAFASLEDRPENVAWRPSERDKAWLKFYTKYKGKISTENAKEAFTTAPLAAYSSLDAKVTNSEMAMNLQSLALFGPPLGNVWEATDREKQSYPEIQPLVPNPWTVLHPNAPAKVRAKVADFRYFGGGFEPGETTAAWFGTLLPKSENDIWLTGAFAEYERLFSTEKALKKDGSLSKEDHQRLAVIRYGHRCNLLAKPTSETAAKPFDLQHDAWVKAEIARGMYVLDAFRMEVGDEVFVEQMEAFGRRFGGKVVTATEFEKLLNGSAAKKVIGAWQLCSKLTPLTECEFKVRVEQFTNESAKKEFKISGTFVQEDVVIAPRVMEVTLEFDDHEVTSLVRIDEKGNFSLTAEDKPSRVILNKYQRTLTRSGGTQTTSSFTGDLANCVIVYGTKDFADAQKNAAEKLHQLIRRGMYNYRVPVVSDQEFNLTQAREKHVILIGTPKTNRVAEKLADSFPVKFESGSFQVEGESYANPKTSMVSVIANPKSPSYSVLMVGGLSGEATYHAVGSLGRGSRAGELLLMPGGGRARSRVLTSGWVGHTSTTN